MKAKKSSPSQSLDVRYVPVDEDLYPEVGEDGDITFYRFWCRPLFIVYEKYKNGVKLGYVVFPDGKDIFQFNLMVSYAESINRGETVCVRKSM